MDEILEMLERVANFSIVICVSIFGVSSTKMNAVWRAREVYKILIEP